MQNKLEPSTVKKVWHLLSAKERRNVLLLLCMIFVGMLLETLGVGMVIPAIALLTQNNFMNKYPALQPLLVDLGNPTQAQLIVAGMLALVLVYLVKALFLALLFWVQTCFAYSVQVRLSQRMFEIYLRQSYAFHLQRNSAKLINNVAGEVGGVIINAVLPCMVLVTESLVLLGMCVMLMIFEPTGTIVVVCTLGLAAWTFHRFTRRHIAHWGEIRQRHEILRMQHLQQGLSGVKDVKLLGRENEFLNQYYHHNFGSANVTKRQAVLLQLPRLWLELLAVCGLAILVISMLVQHRPLEAVLPSLGLFAAAAFRLMPSVNRVLNSIQSIKFGAHGIRTIYGELSYEEPPNAATGESKHFSKQLDLSNICYTYTGSTKPALSHISLQIRHGESIGFVGQSGSGKSTLIDVILGLLAPSTGTISMDGTDIQLNLRNWQSQIGYVPQTIYLTDDTLRRNVAFGLSEEEIDDSAVVRAIDAAQLSLFVSSLPDGLETIVGERGVRLSGGQRQRIGIARALYHDPDILVLDEATSSLDSETESGVMEAIKALKGKKTVLIVAHRLTTVEHCDRLYRFEAGSMVAQGAPAELIPTILT